MTVKELAGVVRCDIDAKTGERLTHREIYGRIIGKLGGLDAIIPMIPYSLDTLRDALPKNEHFNTLSMSCWDVASGFEVSLGKCVLVGSRLTNHLRKYGITAMSNAENVCILKEAARLWVERTEPAPVSDLI